MHLYSFALPDKYARGRESVNMAEILDYFDSINIDIAKRKYYNVNKVNSVLDDLRRLATELVAENDSLRAALREQEDLEKSGMLSLDEIQTVYRETLDKAHDRAAVLESEAEAIKQEAGQKAEYAAKQMEACVRSLRAREEQNIDFLETKLKQFMEILEGEGIRPAPSEEQELQYNEKPFDANLYPAKGEDASDELREIEMRISRLAKEIKALESGE